MEDRGYFIVFEGVEGSGKSTQIPLIVKYLESLGKKVVLTREPGGTEIGTEIRHIILKSGRYMNPMTELFLFEADRAQHIEEFINPSINEGKIVISDRYDTSTIAYQSAGRRLNPILVRNVNNLVAAKCRPDLVIILRIDVEKGLARARSASGKSDRIESEDLNFFQDVQDSYLAQAEKKPHRFKVIEGDQSVKMVHEDIKKVVNEIFHI